MVGLIHCNSAMATDHIRYDILTQNALRGVVRTVLEDAARNGLPGEHHFYIAFDPRAEGVKLSQRMRTQYPEEMTVVLQHQFWDLSVADDHFEVGLSFGGVAERVVVPYAAIKSFADPSVQFGVQFETLVAADVADEDKAAGTEPAARPAAEQQPPAASDVAALPKPANPSTPAETPDPAPGGGEVVRLDRFRKK